MSYERPGLTPRLESQGPSCHWSPPLEVVSKGAATPSSAASPSSTVPWHTAALGHTGGPDTLGQHPDFAGVGQDHGPEHMPWSFGCKKETRVYFVPDGSGLVWICDGHGFTERCSVHLAHITSGEELLLPSSLPPHVLSQGPLETRRKLTRFAHVRFILEDLGSAHCGSHYSDTTQKPGSKLWGNLGDETQTGARA